MLNESIIKTLTNESRVGVVGSQSTNRTLVLDLVEGSRARSLNGKTVIVAPEEYDGGREFGVGTITGITTMNRHHEDRALRGVIAKSGRIDGLTGVADVKIAHVTLQSSFAADPDSDTIRPVGGALSFSPDTGEWVHVANNDLIQHIARQTTEDLFYLGTMYRQGDIDMPMSFYDFSGPRGAQSGGVFGPSGSGKSALATSFTACQLRHLNMAFLLIDPQGQFVTDSKMGTELPLDLRALAEAQGREVRQLSVAHEVRMPEDAALFTNLLEASGFFGANRMIGANQNAENAREIVETWLDKVTENWSDRDSEDLLDEMLEFLRERVEEGSVAVSEEPRKRLADRLTQAIEANTDNGVAIREALLSVWTPILSLFGATSLDGDERRPMKDIVRDLCDPDFGFAGRRKGRPFYILTLADNRPSKSDELGKAMRQEKTQMVVMSTLMAALEREGRRIYQNGSKPSNLMVIMDEAARFTSSTGSQEQRQMADQIAKYMRELRKFAIGFVFILQEPSALHDSIWKQLQNGFRAFAGGLLGNDLAKVREQVTSQGAVELYQQLAKPSIDNPVYPWAFMGSITPLNVTNEPTFIDAYSGRSMKEAARKWEQANRKWLPGTFDVTDVWAGVTA